MFSRLRSRLWFVALLISCAAVLIGASTYSGFKPSPGSTVVWTLPASDGSGCFSSNGAGVVSITSCSGGGGDFSSNTSTSVDSEIVLFSGTGGKTGKRATTTGILKGANGVLSAATAGTDYAGLASTNAYTGYQNISSGQLRFPETTVASLPSAGSNTGKVYVVTDGTSNSDCTTGSGSSRALCTSNGTSWGALGGGGASNIGKQTLWIGAAALTAATTDGANPAQLETGTNKNNIPVLDFIDHGSAKTYGHFTIAFPKAWNLGTLTWKPYWLVNSTSTNSVVWGLQCVARGDNEAIDAAFGTAQEVTDAGSGTANRQLIGAESSALTVAGTPAAEDFIDCRVYRDSAHASDGLNATARLLGLKLYYTTNAATDN